MLKRDIAPDAIKGLCITLMVFGHISYVGSFAGSLAAIKSFIYTFHMPVFFILSGFFFSLRSDADNRFLKLVRRVAIPYTVFIFLYITGLILVQYIGIETTNSPPKSVQDFLSTVLFHPIGGYWFLHSLIVMQLSTLLASYIANKIFIMDNEITLILLILFCLLWLFSEFNVIDFRSASYFILGMSIRQISKEGFYFPSLPLLIFVCVFIIADILGGNKIYIVFSSTEVLWNLLLTSFFWSFFKSHKGIFINNLAWVGRNTLVILVLHALFIVVMKPFNYYFLRLEHTGILQSLIVTLITIVGCMLSAKLFDSLNISKYIFGVDNIYSRRC